MNLEKLFKMQKELDERILDRFPELRDEDLLDKKILALQVELGELAQNWRGFKFWSEDKEPRMLCLDCKGTGYCHYHGFADSMTPCGECDGYPKNKNPMLEEFVDCLHFILSIGNHVGAEAREPRKLISFFKNVTQEFNTVFRLISEWDEMKLLMDEELFHIGLNNFLNLGELLGFTWEQIEAAYYAKNEINHTRQNNGY